MKNILDAICADPNINPAFKLGLRSDGPMARARQIVEDHIRAYGYIPHPDKLKDEIAAQLGFVQLAATPPKWRETVEQLRGAVGQLLDSLPPDFPNRAYYDEITAAAQSNVLPLVDR